MSIKKYTFTSVFLFFATVNNVESIKDIKTLLLALMVATGVFSILALIDYLMFEPSFGSRLSFHYLDRNLNRFSKFYDIVIPINLTMVFVTKNKIKKLLFMFVLMLSLATILLMQTRGSYIVIFLGLLAITFVYRKKLFMFMLALPLVTIFLMPTNMTPRAKEMLNLQDYMRSGGVLHYRIDAWKGALRIISKNPLLGIGVGKSIYGKTAREFQDLTIPYVHAHNTYLQIAVELGLIGLGAFLWLFGTVFYHGIKSKLSLPHRDEKAILIFGIICGIGALFLHGAIASFYKNEAFFMLWFSVALLFALTENDKFQKQKIANSESFLGSDP
jgi:O-antigen ligase